MATKLFTPIRGKRIRVTELDECGRVMPTSRKIVTNGFVTVTITAEVEDGTETTLRRADGALCVSELDNPTLKHLTLEIDPSSLHAGFLPPLEANEPPLGDADSEQNRVSALSVELKSLYQ